MADFALVINGSFVRGLQADVKPVDIPHKNVVWLPFVRSSAPTFDLATQVLSGPTITIYVDHVSSDYSVRQKTQKELDADKQAYVDNVDMLIFKVLLNHENRIRALESNATITAQKFKTALLGML